MAEGRNTIAAVQLLHKTFTSLASSPSNARIDSCDSVLIKVISANFVIVAQACKDN